MSEMHNWKLEYGEKDLLYILTYIVSDTIRRTISEISELHIITVYGSTEKSYFCWYAGCPTNNRAS